MSKQPAILKDYIRLKSKLKQKPKPTVNYCSGSDDIALSIQYWPKLNNITIADW